MPCKPELKNLHHDRFFCSGPKSPRIFRNELCHMGALAILAGVSNKDNASRHYVAMPWVGFKDTARRDDYNAAWYMEQFTHSIAPAAAETLDLETLPPPGRASGHLMIVAKAGQGEFCMEVSGNTYVLRSRMEELEVGGQVPALLVFGEEFMQMFSL